MPAGINWTEADGWVIDPEKTDHKTDHKTDYRTDYTYTTHHRECRGWGPWKKCRSWTETHWDHARNRPNQLKNEVNTEKNRENRVLNAKNTRRNDAYTETVNIAGRTQGGDYTTQRSAIRNLRVAVGDEAVKSRLEDLYKDYYRADKLEEWDVNLGRKPLYGDFDASYYINQTQPGSNAKENWRLAVIDDDIDITERYSNSPNHYYLQHYTNVAPSSTRGNKAEITTQANNYIEETPTDSELSEVRRLQLGINTDTQTERLLNIPEVQEEWTKAKRDDPYWRNLGKEKFLDVKKADEFAALFRISERDQDKQVKLNYNINAGYGITELEDALNEAVGEKATVDVKRFAALTQNVLKDTINEMKIAKGREETLATMRGFSGFQELMDINNTLSDSILGDTGVGGVLAFTSGGKAEESLEKGLEGITGVRNNNTYNWQQFFDTKLKDKYAEATELGYTKDGVEEMIQIEGDFARQFMDDYLIPRFNTSRSMDEFVEYLDVRQSEQNPFQTQDIVNAVKLVGDLKADSYLDQLRAEADRRFDPDFYFDPTGNVAREGGWSENSDLASYEEQKRIVNEDWEAAKNGDEYWRIQAYRFGIDPTDKAAFAKMHFQVKGQAEGYDAADDILNAGKVKDHIYTNILPHLEEEALQSGSVFGQFITPEEFADDLLQGLDPSDKGSWEEILERYGLKDFKGSFDELKDFIVETLRTGSAQEIREQIKYLNEKRKKPTQQTLGITYIERPEDYKDEMAKPKTELYSVFQNAGFQGTEDEFYDNFFPDLERSEQTLLTKAGKNDPLKTFGLDLQDPFASLGTIESFFADDEDDNKDQKEIDENKKRGYFTLDPTDEDEWEYDPKKKKEDEVFGEFTTMFQGL